MPAHKGFLDFQMLFHQSKTLKLRNLMTFSSSFEGSFNDLVVESFACVWLIEATWCKLVFVLVWTIASKSLNI